MIKILQQTFNKSIEREFDYQFSVPDNGLYFIEIVVSAKSWSQNFSKLRSFFKADNLAVKIDEIVFIENPKKQQDLFTGAAAWNGNILKGYSKTNIFALRFQSGNHVLRFSSTQAPILESVQIYQIEDGKEISHIPAKNQIQDRDRYSLVTFIFFDLPINLLNITVKARQGKTFSFLKRDDSDLQIIIDGEIQRNDEPKSHKEWYWCGRTLKGKSKTFSKELNFTKGIHSVELKADRNPEIENVSFETETQETQGKKEFDISYMKPYTSKGVNEEEDYNRFDYEILDAVNKWNKYFSSQQYSPPISLDPNLVKAMIYIESRMGYHKTADGYYSAYPDVMQIGDPRNPAIHTLNNDGWIDPVTGKIAREYEWKDGKELVLDYQGEVNIITSKESIDWGVRWLYHKAQGITNEGTRYWREWNEAVKNYNGNGNIKYEQQVFDVYLHGDDKRNEHNWVKLWVLFLLGISVAATAIVLGTKFYNDQGKVWLTFDESREEGIRYILAANVVKGFHVKKKEVSKFYDDGRNFFDMTIEGNPRLSFHDLWGDDKIGIVITGSGISTSYTNRYILRETKEGLETVFNIDEYGAKKPAFHGNWIDFIDVDKDRVVEVRESGYIPYSDAPDQVWQSWYKYNQENGTYEFFKKDKINVNGIEEAMKL